MKLSLSIFRRLIFVTVLISSICSVVGGQTKKPIKQISAGIVNGKALTLPKPDYPDDARKAKLSGTVKVQVLIDEAGKVVSANAVSGLENISLRIAAETAALKATFSPTRLSGQPVKVSGVIVYNFVAEKSNEEKLKVMGVSAFLTIARSFASDLDKYKEVFDETELFKDEIIDFGEFASEIKTLQGIEKLSVEKRLDVVDKAISSIHSKLTQPDLWQFEVGKNLGDMFGSMLWVAASAAPGDLSKLDGPSVKLSLNRIRDLTLSAPPDFPQDVLAKLKEVAAVGSKDDLATSENLKELYEKLELLIEVISPGATK